MYTIPIEKIEQIAMTGFSGCFWRFLRSGAKIMSSEISDFQNFSVLSDFYAGDVPDQVTWRLEERRLCDRQAFPLAHQRGERVGRALIK